MEWKGVLFLTHRGKMALHLRKHFLFIFFILIEILFSQQISDENLKKYSMVNFQEVFRELGARERHKVGLNTFYRVFWVFNKQWKSV